MEQIIKIPAQMILNILIILSTLVMSNCSAIDIQLKDKIAKREKIHRVAILPFRIHGAHFGSEFADAIGLHLAQKPWFVQIERGPELMKILNEQGFSQTGLIDTKTRIQIGKLTSANLIIIGQGTALEYTDQEGKKYNNLIDTFSLKAIDVESGSHLITIRKRPGRAWTWPTRLKWLLSFSLIWNREDVLIESSEYDDLARQIANKIEDHILDKKAKIAASLKNKP